MQAKLGVKYLHINEEAIEGSTTPADPSNWAFWDEKCYISVGNYREPEGIVQQEEEKKPLDKKAQMLA